MESIQNLDQQFFIFLNNLGNSTWDGFWVVMTNQWMSIPVYILLSWLILRKTGFKSTFVSMTFIFFMVVAVYGLSHLVKYGVARPRPCTMGFDMRFPLHEDCGDYGFFSTHASVGMALMLFIGLILKPYYKYILWPLMTWLTLFCYSRIYVGKHYPGDIIVGLLVGLIFGVLFYRLRGCVVKHYKV